MNIEPSNRESRSIEKPIKSLDDVLKEVIREGEKIPGAQRVEEIPLSREVFDSVQSYIKDELKLPTGASGNGAISIAGEFLNRTSLGAGRVGTLKGLPVFAFIYQIESNRIGFVGIFPRDGVDARKIAQAIYWTIVSDIPTTHAQSKLLSRDDFRSVNAFDETALCDAPALEKLRAEITAEADRAVIHADTRAAESEKQIKRLGKEVAVEKQSCEDNRQAAVVSHNRAEMWKLAALLFFAVAILLMLIKFFA